MFRWGDGVGRWNEDDLEWKPKYRKRSVSGQTDEIQVEAGAACAPGRRQKKVERYWRV